MTDQSIFAKWFEKETGVFRNLLTVVCSSEEDDAFSEAVGGLVTYIHLQSEVLAPVHVIRALLRYLTGNNTCICIACR